MNFYIFTSESVSEGHPDKIADQISDAILDYVIKIDKNASVCCETYIKSNLIIVGGEIDINFNILIDIEYIVRNIIKNIGYIDDSMGLNFMSCKIFNFIKLNYIDKNIKKKKSINKILSNQALIFGYATNETDILMPAPIMYANNLMLRQSYLRKNGILNWLYPYAKSQVTLIYKNDKVFSVDTISISVQNSLDIAYKELREYIMEEIIFFVFPKNLLNKKTKYYINSIDNFVKKRTLLYNLIGITGRKIIVDTYGGMCRHGGGSFSGKDPYKIDRSASYMARYIAKNIVYAGLADKCEIQISYVYGCSKPIYLMIETFKTEKIPLLNLYKLINTLFDFSVLSIIKNLDLLNVIYLNTSVYGHFGRNEFTWEKLNLKNKLLNFVNN